MTEEEKEDFIEKGNNILSSAIRFADELDNWAQECKKYPTLEEDMKGNPDMEKLAKDMEIVSNRIGM